MHHVERRAIRQAGGLVESTLRGTRDAHTALERTGSRIGDSPGIHRTRRGRPAPAGRADHRVGHRPERDRPRAGTPATTSTSSRVAAGSRAIRSRRTSQPTAGSPSSTTATTRCSVTSSRRRPPRSPIPTSARSATTTRAAWTRRPSTRGALTPLSADLARIAAVKTRARLAPAISALHAKGVPAFFGFGSSPDFKDASKVIAAVDQGGLGLPDRDYYLKDDEHSKTLREEYVAHVAADAGAARERRRRSADGGAQTVMQIETALAKVALDRRQPARPDEHLPQDGARASLAS